LEKITVGLWLSFYKIVYVVCEKISILFVKKNIIWNENWKRPWRERPQCAS